MAQDKRIYVIVAETVQAGSRTGASHACFD